MVSAKATGYAAGVVGGPLEPLAWTVPTLGGHDVRVAVSHCGVCYTDIQAIDDFYGITTFPFVPGHEIVGHVEARGSAVSELEVGERVGIGWQGRSCGGCRWCEQGEVQLCYDIAETGTWERHGGFADSVTVDASFAYRLPAGMPSAVVSVLMCAGISVYAPLKRYAGDGPRVAIYGLGGLGHLAVQFAHALGYEVTAISSSEAKEAEARHFGADHFILTADRDRLRQSEFEVDLLLCTAHGGVDWQVMIDLLEKRGRLVLVGFPEMSIWSRDVVVHEVSITGSFTGNHATMNEMLSFAHTHGITPEIELLPMADVNDAIRRLKEGSVRYRIVLANDSSA